MVDVAHCGSSTLRVALRVRPDRRRVGQPRLDAPDARARRGSTSGAPRAASCG